MTHRHSLVISMIEPFSDIYTITHTRTHARTHAHTHTHKRDTSHINIYVIFMLGQIALSENFTTVPWVLNYVCFMRIVV